MKLFSLLFLSLIITSSFIGETEFDKALQKAKDEHKLVLVRFSGSDWCIPCIKMGKEIFENADFKNYAESSLVLVVADFPRLKKNKLPADQQKANDELAEKYNRDGNFPLTVLTDENGTVLKTWEGYSNMTPGEFISQLKQFADDRK